MCQCPCARARLPAPGRRFSPGAILPIDPSYSGSRGQNARGGSARLADGPLPRRRSLFACLGAAAVKFHLDWRMRPIELERESPCGGPPARKRGADLLEETINTQRQKSLAPVGLVLVALVVALAAGCGSSKKATSTTTTVATASTGTRSTATAVDTKIAAEVPAAIKSKGTLIVAANPHYAPNEFIGTDTKTIVGMDPDLAKALAAVMGLKAKVVSASFSSIIPGVSTGKFNLGMSSITDTSQREKSVDFVTYFKAGTMFFTNATGGLVIQKGLAD